MQPCVIGGLKVYTRGSCREGEERKRLRRQVFRAVTADSERGTELRCSGYYPPEREGKQCFCPDFEREERIAGGD